MINEILVEPTLPELVIEVLALSNKGKTLSTALIITAIKHDMTAEELRDLRHAVKSGRGGLEYERTISGLK